MVMTPAFHPRGPGSIPGVGEPLFVDAFYQCLTARQGLVAAQLRRTLAMLTSLIQVGHI